MVTFEIIKSRLRLERIIDTNLTTSQKEKKEVKKKNRKKNTKNNIIIEKIPETVLRIEKTYIFLFEFRVASVLSSVFFPPKYRKEKNVEHLILNNEILPTRSCQRQ